MCSARVIFFAVPFPVRVHKGLVVVSIVWATSPFLCVTKAFLTKHRIVCVALSVLGICIQSLALKVGGLFFGSLN